MPTLREDIEQIAERVFGMYDDWTILQVRGLLYVVRDCLGRTPTVFEAIDILPIAKVEKDETYPATREKCIERLKYLRENP